MVQEINGEMDVTSTVLVKMDRLASTDVLTSKLYWWLVLST